MKHAGGMHTSASATDQTDGVQALPKTTARYSSYTPDVVNAPGRIASGILDGETVATVIRITGGNFRLLNRLLTQPGRVDVLAARSLHKQKLSEARSLFFFPGIYGLRHHLITQHSGGAP